jgi:hypothetical protein
MSFFSTVILYRFGARQDKKCHDKNENETADHYVNLFGE